MRAATDPQTMAVVCAHAPKKAVRSERLSKTATDCRQWLLLRVLCAHSDETGCVCVRRERRKQRFQDMESVIGELSSQLEALKGVQSQNDELKVGLSAALLGPGCRSLSVER